MNVNNSIFDLSIVNNVILYDEIGSTNNTAKEFARSGSVEGTLIISDMQTAGKGRLGRSFSSPSGAGIYMSLALKPHIDISNVPTITTVVALALVKALKEVPGLNPSIKWPNDILINNKKLVGILTEGSLETTEQSNLAESSLSTLQYIIIGIGINVNNKDFPPHIDNVATSIFRETGKEYDRWKIIERVLYYLDYYYNIFLETEDMSKLIEEYNSNLSTMNMPVVLVPHNDSITNSNTYDINADNLNVYTCLGLDKHGLLICEDKDGNIIHVNSGEVSLRHPK